MQEGTTKICRYCNAVSGLQDTFCGRCGRPFLMTDLNTTTGYIDQMQSERRAPTLSNTVPAGTPVPSSPFTMQAPPPPPSPHYQSQQRQRPKKYFVLICALLVLVVGGVGIEIGRLSKSGSVQSLIPGNITTNQPTAPAQPQPGTVLYQENGSDNWKGWSGSADWKVLNGTLVNDGTYNTNSVPPTIVAPYEVQGTSDYAVEVTARIQREITGMAVAPEFVIALRGSSNGGTWQGYLANMSAPGSTNTVPTAYIENNNPDFAASILASAPFDPGTTEHTYRFEVKGNDLKLFIDNSLKLETQDNRFLTGGQAGLVCYDMEVSISSFKITVL